MEDMKLVKMITDWNPIGVRSIGRPKNRWSDEVVNDLKQLKLRICSHIIKVGKAWNYQMQKTESHVGL
jgi:hypothetical protein